MNNKIKSEKYRKLSVAALVTGILAVSLGAIFFLRPSDDFMNIPNGVMNAIVGTPPQVLLIAAVVCGSIDLIRIKAGRYSNKGRGFDIAGIVLGGTPIFALLVLLLFMAIFSQ